MSLQKIPAYTIGSIPLVGILWLLEDRFSARMAGMLVAANVAGKVIEDFGQGNTGASFVAYATTSFFAQQMNLPWSTMAALAFGQVLTLPVIALVDNYSFSQ